MQRSIAAWGMMRFSREAQATDAFPDWHDALREAQAILEQRQSAVNAVFPAKSGPYFVAAYLLRDHYAELTPSELEWCRRLVIEAVLRKDAERTFETRISKNRLDGSRPCALVLPLLLKGAIDDKTRGQVEECLAVAVTHTSEEVRDYAAEGIRSWLWIIDAALAKLCVGGLCELASVEKKIWQANRRMRKVSHERSEDAVWAAMIKIRARIVKRKTFIALRTPTVDLETHNWPELLDALSMIEPGTRDADLRAFIMACLTAVLREAETAEAWQSGHRGQVSYEFQYAFARLFTRFALARPVAEAAQIGQLLRDFVDRCPEYLEKLLEKLPYEEDRVQSGEAFWSIWKSVSAPIFAHKLLRGSSRIWRYDEVRKLVRVLLFADVEWKDGINEWAPVTVNKDFIELAASVVGNTPAGFGALVSLLSSVGQVFLPDAIKLLADGVKRANGMALLEDRTGEFQLEVLLRKVCYSFGTIVRQRPDLHRALIFLLDKLVERGSHTAFRLRDYMIAPLPTVN